MELYFIRFYDYNESGNVIHTELYSSFHGADKRLRELQEKLNAYSWVSMHKAATTENERIVCGEVVAKCDFCNGDDNYYHGDEDDF